MGEDGNFYHSRIRFLIANNTIRCQDIIIGTKWLKLHKASLDLDTNSSLKLRLKNKKGAVGLHRLSLEPDNSTFALKDKDDDYFETYSTNLIFNNESKGTLHFEKNQVGPINFEFDTINLVEWVKGCPTMPNRGTTLQVPRYLLLNKKIGHIEFTSGINTNLIDIPGPEKAGNGWAAGKQV